MATFAVPDNKQLPNYAVVGEPIEVGAHFPFKVFLKEGYFTQNLEINGPSLELIFTPPRDWKPTSACGWNEILCVIGGSGLLGPYTLRWHGSGWGTGPSVSVDADVNYEFIGGVKYRAVFTLTGSFLRVDFYQDCGGDRIQRIQLLGGFINDLTLMFGYPTSDIRAAVPDDPLYPRTVPEGLVIHALREQALPTAISLFPGTVDTAWAKPLRSVGKFIVSHPYEKDGWRIYFSSGGGGTDNELFEIRGDELFAIDQLTPGYKYIRVRVRDKFDMAPTAQNLVLGVGLTAPTDIVLSNSDIETDQVQFGILSTVDADPGETFTYTLVSGEGDTHNGNFYITGIDGETAYLTRNSPANGVLTETVRIRSTDALGLYREEAFVIRSLDTTPPVINSFIVDPADNTWTLPITNISAENSPAVGPIHYLVTADQNLTPEANDPNWSLDVPSSYEIPLGIRNGVGTYTIFIWVKDDSNNINPTPASANGSVTDTEAPAITIFSAACAANSYTAFATGISGEDAFDVQEGIQPLYMMTEANVAPLAGDPGWADVNASHFVELTPAGPGSYTVYLWAKDRAGNVTASGYPTSVAVTDTVLPFFSSVTMSNAASYVVPLTLIGVDTDGAVTSGVAGYLAQMANAGTPDVSDPRWETPAPANFTIPLGSQVGSGTYTIECWLKDGSGNINGVSQNVTLTIGAAPVMTAFTIPATGTSYVVPISTKAATDAEDGAVTLFNINTTNIQPAANHPDWLSSWPTYTLIAGGSGDYTLYCWAKDSDNNVSATSISATITLTIA